MTMRTNTLHRTLAAAGLVCFSHFAAAQVVVDGDLKLKTEVTKSTVVATALGPGAKASTDVGSIVGNVRVKGSISLNTTLQNSTVVATAVGRGVRFRLSADGFGRVEELIPA